MTLMVQTRAGIAPRDHAAGEPARRARAIGRADRGRQARGDRRRRARRRQGALRRAHARDVAAPRRAVRPHQLRRDQRAAARGRDVRQRGAEQARPDRARRGRHRVPRRHRPAAARPAAEAAARDRGRARCAGTPSAQGRARSTSATSRRRRRISPAEVDAGRFRRDLYFRLAGATFTIPPLRERKDEVLPLAEQFVASAAGPLGRSFMLAEEATAVARPRTTGPATSASCATRASAPCCSRPAR